jgi:hypothetical protein
MDKLNFWFLDVSAEVRRNGCHTAKLGQVNHKLPHKGGRGKLRMIGDQSGNAGERSAWQALLWKRWDVIGNFPGYFALHPLKTWNKADPKMPPAELRFFLFRQEAASQVVDANERNQKTHHAQSQLCVHEANPTRRGPCGHRRFDAAAPQ